MHKREQAFSILEVVTAITIVSVMVGMAAWSLDSTLANARVRSAARSVADLMVLARGEAIRSGVPHLVFFGLDAAGDPLLSAGGQPAAGVVIRDDDGDGLVDAGETIAALPIENNPALAWGSSLAASAPAAAPDDNTTGSNSFPRTAQNFLCCTFIQPDGSDASWVAFLPDGTPRAFSSAPFAAGDIASGNGSVYLTSGERDFAVVLAALGGVRLHAWNEGAGSWTR